VPKGVVAVSQDDELSISRLLDINLEGLSIVQQAKGALKEDSIELDILALHEEEGKDLFLSGIKARVLSEMLMSGAKNSIEQQIRYSLHFRDLSGQQYEALKRYISRQSPS